MYVYIPKQYSSSDNLYYSINNTRILIVSIVIGSVESKDCTITDIYGDTLYNVNKERIYLEDSKLFIKKSKAKHDLELEFYAAIA